MMTNLYTNILSKYFQLNSLAKINVIILNIGNILKNNKILYIYHNIN